MFDEFKLQKKKDIKLHIQKAEQAPYKINSNKSIVNLLKIKENILKLPREKWWIIYPGTIF